MDHADSRGATASLQGFALIFLTAADLTGTAHRWTRPKEPTPTMLARHRREQTPEPQSSVPRPCRSLAARDDAPQARYLHARPPARPPADFHELVASWSAGNVTAARQISTNSRETAAWLCTWRARGCCYTYSIHLTPMSFLYNTLHDTCALPLCRAKNRNRARPHSRRLIESCRENTWLHLPMRFRFPLQCVKTRIFYLIARRVYARRQPSFQCCPNFDPMQRGRGLPNYWRILAHPDQPLL